MTKSSRRRTLALTSAASVAALLALAACSSNSSAGSGSGSSNSASITLTEEDYYGSAPQNTQIQGVLNECGAQVGVKVVHSVVPQGQLMPKLLQQASARSLPDLMLVDNPDLQQLASTGGLVSLSANGLSTAGLYPSIVSAGSYQGQTYGIAPGVNDLALYYNETLFTKAGLTPPKTWAQLTADAKTLTSGTRKGIAFSAVSTEEGSFQFEPFFWSAGGGPEEPRLPAGGSGPDPVEVAGGRRVRLQVRGQLDPGGRRGPVPGRQRGDDGQRPLAAAGPQRHGGPALRRRPDPGAFGLGPGRLAAGRRGVGGWAQQPQPGGEGRGDGQVPAEPDASVLRGRKTPGTSRATRPPRRSCPSPTRSWPRSSPRWGRRRPAPPSLAPRTRR